MIIEVGAIVVASLTGVGLIATWVKNGRQNMKERTQLETNIKSEIKDIKDDIKNPNYGLSAINKKLDDHLLYCAKKSTNLEARVHSLEKTKRGGD